MADRCWGCAKWCLFAQWVVLPILLQDCVDISQECVVACEYEAVHAKGSCGIGMSLLVVNVYNFCRRTSCILRSEQKISGVGFLFTFFVRFKDKIKMSMQVYACVV